MSRRGILAFGLAGVLVTGVVVAVTLSSSRPENEVVSALVYGTMVALPVGVGLYAWRRQPDSRFGPLLVLAGFLWSATVLSQTDVPALYSIGRVSGWLVEPFVILLVLSFPSGRVTDTPARIVVGLITGLVAFLYLPTALLVDQYPIPSPWGTCDSGCPENAFMIPATQPGVVDSVVIPVREVLTVVVLVTTTALIAARIARATPVMRRTLVPVLVAATVNVVMLSAMFYMRSQDIVSGVVFDSANWLWLLSMPGIALGFMIGLLRSRLFAADALERLLPRLRVRGPAVDPRAALAEALDDPRLELAYCVPGKPRRWIRSDGARLSLPPAGERSMTEIRDGDEVLGVVIHDPALLESRALVEAAGAAALVSAENQRLAAELRASLGELRESRARIVAAADGERRRIERDLHDSAQQQLVSMRVRLKLAEERAGSGEIGELFGALGDEVEAIVDEIRSLARGIYPALLADRGLSEALSAAALRAPVTVTVDADGVDRLPAEVENAIYFCCLEALQNAVKHSECSAVRISLSANGVLRFEVRDDGDGFDVGAVRPGSGITNMRDRIAAVGGKAKVESIRGEGTRVSGVVPGAGYRRLSRDSRSTAPVSAPLSSAGAHPTG